MSRCNPLPLRLLGGLVLAAAAAAPVAAQERPAAATVQVSGFRVSGNTLLPQAQIDAALAPFLGARRLDELERAAAALQALYASAGYGGVVAFVPPQTAADGQVAITVVEGRIARIVVQGATTFGEANARASLPALEPGRTPLLRRLDAQLQLANENPAKQTQLLLQPGAQAGEVDARITVVERPLQRWTVALDNTGNDRSGEWRAGLTWQHANLSGRDDVLTAQYQTSPDEPSLVKVASAGYRLPRYALPIVIDAYAAYSDVANGSTATAAGDLRFNGRGRLLGVRAAWLLPRMGEVDRRLIVGLDQRAYLNDCAIVGLPPGACGPAGESVTVQPLSAEFVLRSRGSFAWALSLGVQHNLQLGGSRTGDERFEAVRPGAKPRYTSWRLGGAVGVPVAEDWQVQARLAAQWTGDPLVPGEQFGLGGAGAVRGYEEREVIGDRGVQASLEVAAPAIALGGFGTLRLLAFADAGQVENLLATPCLAGRTRCTLAGAGVGARVDAGATQLRMHVAQALREGAQTAKNDTRAHVFVSHSF